jgi:hypothetical protein
MDNLRTLAKVGGIIVQITAERLLFRSRSFIFDQFILTIK